MKGVLWAQPCQLGAQDFPDMFKTLCIDVVFKAVPVRMNKPATDRQHGLSESLKLSN